MQPDRTTEEQATVDQLLVKEIRTYAKGRESDVERGAETPELAALLTDKVAWGMHLAARALGFDTSTLIAESDRLVAAIDPDFAAHREKRWAARPAALTPREG
jgi:hypothetical protein